MLYKWKTRHFKEQIYNKSSVTLWYSSLGDRYSIIYIKYANVSDITIWSCKHALSSKIEETLQHIINCIIILRLKNWLERFSFKVTKSMFNQLYINLQKYTKSFEPCLFNITLNSHSKRQKWCKSTTSVYTYGRVYISYISVWIGGVRHTLVMN